MFGLMALFCELIESHKCHKVSSITTKLVIRMFTIIVLTHRASHSRILSFELYSKNVYKRDIQTRCTFIMTSLLFQCHRRVISGRRRSRSNWPRPRDQNRISARHDNARAALFISRQLRNSFRRPLCCRCVTRAFIYYQWFGRSMRKSVYKEKKADPFFEMNINKVLV